MRRDSAHAEIAYTFVAGDRGTATAPLVTVSSPDDNYPPITDILPVNGSGRDGGRARRARVRPALRGSRQSLYDQGATSDALTRYLAPEV